MVVERIGNSEHITLCKRQIGRGLLWEFRGPL
ncbi:hypothetical protein MTR67_053286 [Solanum verrucosum]|uniref:Uncharacterized protein n=1 Tax=Solanum verrucosum TaxID=315347 RepID=A0AAF0VAC6_SOLVR|nr:hypothetical protein MTR67_053286 [Solanum verrucosum]